MATDSRKRHQQKLKRERKRAQTQRAQANPYRHVGQGGAVVACYINRGWRDDGMISLHVLRRRSDGGHTMAAFLIDRWCIGLKDAFGHLNMSPSEFQENVISRMSQNVELERADVGLAKRLVAAGVRFAHQNGFRLPRRWDRWAQVLGDIGDWKSADLSHFGMDGKLCFVGNEEDLRKRLIGCTVEAFLARPDVEYMMGPPIGPLDDDEDLPDVIEEGIDVVLDRALEKVRRWCFARQIAPSPRLPEVIEHTLRSAGVFCSESELDEEPDEADYETMRREFEELVARQTGQDAIDYQRAMDQMQQFIQQFPSPDDFMAALDLPEDDEQ